MTRITNKKFKSNGRRGRGRGYGSGSGGGGGRWRGGGGGGAGVDLYSRPSKCPKFYKTIISGEKNLRQKEHQCCQNWNCGKFPYFLKYKLKYTILLNTLSILVY